MCLLFSGKSNTDFLANPIDVYRTTGLESGDPLFAEGIRPGRWAEVEEVLVLYKIAKTNNISSVTECPRSAHWAISSLWARSLPVLTSCPTLPTVL